MGWGIALAIASTLYSIKESRDNQKEVKAAQERQEDVEKGVQEEQATRERRKQIRQSMLERSRVANLAGAQGRGGASGNTDIANAYAAVDANLGRNLGTINATLSGQNAISSARSNVFNAGRPSTFGLINQTLQPFIFSNIDAIDEFGSKGSNNVFKE